MADVGDRIEVTGTGAPRSGVVTAVSDVMLTVLWDTGEETNFIPGAGDLKVLPGRRRRVSSAPGSKVTSKRAAARKPAAKRAPARKTAANKARTAKPAAKRAPAPKVGAKKARTAKSSGKRTTRR